MYRGEKSKYTDAVDSFGHMCTLCSGFLLLLQHFVTTIHYNLK